RRHLPPLLQPKDEPRDLRPLPVARGVRRLLFSQELFPDLPLEDGTQLVEAREDDPVGGTRLSAHGNLDTDHGSVARDSPDLAGDTVDVVRVLEGVRGVNNVEGGRRE